MPAGWRPSGEDQEPGRKVVLASTSTSSTCAQARPGAPARASGVGRGSPAPPPPCQLQLLAQARHGPPFASRVQWQARPCPTIGQQANSHRGPPEARHLELVVVQLCVLEPRPHPGAPDGVEQRRRRQHRALGQQHGRRQRTHQLHHAPAGGTHTHQGGASLPPAGKLLRPATREPACAGAWRCGACRLGVGKEEGARERDEAGVLTR